MNSLIISLKRFREQESEHSNPDSTGKLTEREVEIKMDLLEKLSAYKLVAMIEKTPTPHILFLSIKLIN